MKLTGLSLAFLLAAPLVASGCSMASGSRECPAPAPSDHPQRFPGETLTILDQGSFPSFAELKPLFENLTGATVTQIDGGDAGNALRNALEGAGHPPADLLYGVDNALFFTHRVRDACLFVPYESPRVNAINRTLIDVDAFRIDGRLWTTPVDHGYVSVNYDIRLRDTVPANELPATLRDLAQHRWASSFVTEDPRTSSPGLLFLLATIATFPEDAAYTWTDYWRDLLRNGTLVASDWTEAYAYHYTGGYGQYDNSTFIGDRRLVVSYTTSPAVEVYFGAHAPPGVSLEPPGGVSHQIETMGILRGSPHVGLASAFIDFALTHPFQDRAAPQLAVYPVIDNVTLPREFQQYATDPADLRPAATDAGALSAHLDDWLAQWVKLYQSERA